MFATRERGRGRGEERARDRQSLCVRTSGVGHVRGLGDSRTIGLLLGASANVGKGLPDTTRRIYNDGGPCLFCRRLLESIMSPSSDCWPEHVLQSALAADYFCHVFKAP